MTVHEQRMCELQAELFEISTSRFKCSSQYFVSRFMHSRAAESLDEIDDPYNFYSPNNILSMLESEYSSLNDNIGESLPENIMRWVGYIYRAWSILKHKKSSVIYKYCKVENLLSLYDSFHTLDAIYCVDRLDELFTKKEIDEYQIYREMVLSGL